MYICTYITCYYIILAMVFIQLLFVGNGSGSTRRLDDTLTRIMALTGRHDALLPRRCLVEAYQPFRLTV